MSTTVNLLGSLLLRLIAGRHAGLLMRSGRFGIVGDIVGGILGAFVGGWLAERLLGIGVTGFNVNSIAIVLVGAVIAIAIFRTLTPRRRWFA